MKKLLLTVAISALTLGLATTLALPVGAADGGTVYGYQLMTPEERQTHMQAMREATTQEERDALRQSQHELMKQRAAERGLTMPDQPPAAGMGPGPGMGRGRGMGPERGMGPVPRRLR